MQIANSFDAQSLKNIGMSLLKTLAAALVTALIGFVGGNIDAISHIFKDPTMVAGATLAIRFLITTATEWQTGEKTVAS